MKVVGEIKPPDYKDPATMLRNIANMIDEGTYTNIETIGIVMTTEDGYFMFGGGKQSGMEHVGFAFGVAQLRLQGIPLGVME